jgi:hypothetical protein
MRHAVPGESHARLYALSLKQPWAALVAHGLKTIEVRTWPVSYRGPILIHAARINDNRPEGWQYLTDEARETAKLKGGVIAQTELLSCVYYPTQAQFSVDQSKHRNEVEWFRTPGMYGFVFGAVQRIAFHPWKGNVRLFTVTLPGAEDVRAAAPWPRQPRRGLPSILP